MTEHLENQLREYDRLIAEKGAVPEKAEGHMEGFHMAMGHARWMIQTLLTRGHLFPATQIHTWVGFIRGILWTRNLITFEEARGSFHE